MKKDLIHFTETAKKHLMELYEQSEHKFIKIKLTTKGCSGNSYDLSFIDESAVNPLDEQIQIPDNFTVVIDFLSSMWIAGTTIDWHEDKWGSKFTFTNPKITDSCGCGESFHFENPNNAN